MQSLKKWGLPILLGLVGMAGYLISWHLWLDHQAGHQYHQKIDVLWQLEVQREQAAAAAQKAGGS